MRKVVLLCAAGMSTSLLVNKMRDAAKEEGYDCGFCEKYTFLKPTSVYDENKDCEYFEER